MKNTSRKTHYIKTLHKSIKPTLHKITLHTKKTLQKSIKLTFHKNTLHKKHYINTSHKQNIT